MNYILVQVQVQVQVRIIEVSKMEKEILVEPLQKRFKVSVKDANKQSRNRSYSNASNCCGSKLSQEKKCSGCGEKVASGECQRKIVKIGKEEHLIEASALKQCQETFAESGEIVLSTFMDKRPEGSEDRFGSLVYASPAEKRDAEYDELRKVLKNKVAIGKGVFRSNEFQVIVEVGADNLIRIRKLVEESQRYDAPEVPAEMELNGEIVDLERAIIEKAVVDEHDVTEFRDTRSAMEEKVIEEFVLHGKVPEIKQEVKQEQETNELERLKALVH